MKYHEIPKMHPKFWNNEILYMDFCAILLSPLSPTMWSLQHPTWLILTSSQLPYHSESTPTLCPIDHCQSPCQAGQRSKKSRSSGQKWEFMRLIGNMKCIDLKHTPQNMQNVCYTSHFLAHESKIVRLYIKCIQMHQAKLMPQKGNKSRLDPVEQENMQWFFLCIATLTAESSKYPCTRFPMSKAPIIMKITNITIDQNKEDKKHWPCIQRWNSKCQILKKYLLHKSKKSRWYCDRSVPPLVPQQTWKGAKPPARYI